MSAVASLAGPAVVAPVRCRHCGDVCGADAVASSHGSFCCQGCESVYAILTAHNLEAYYTCDPAAGVSQKEAGRRDRAHFAALDDPEIASRLIEFDDGHIARVTLSVPAIHCASCVWLLEQLWRFDAGAVRSEVDLMRRTVTVHYRPRDTNLRAIAEQLAALGYEPSITTERGSGGSASPMRRLYLQIGVAGFAFGNIMLFSIPRYVNGAPLEGGFQRLFDALNVLFAIPVLLFSASGYFRIAWHAIRTKTMALEIPVALGLAVLFGRSIVEIGTGRGEGFMDSFAGLAFFLLIGRLFQQKVFERIAFDRTFRSFLPLSVRVEREDGWSIVPIERLRPGDRVAVRPNEIVPADAVLLDESGQIDYAFITGEQTPVSVREGETVRAGGRVIGSGVRLRIMREVSQSQLASLWSHPVFSRQKRHWLTDVTARFGAWFTAGAIALAAAGAVAWWPDLSTSASVATAVLIVACPCALVLSAPITLGTAMGVLGGRGVFLKHPAVALDLSRVDTVAFDKTGTLTMTHSESVAEAHGLSARGWALVRRLAAESTHPASRAIASSISDTASADPDTRTAVALRLETVHEVGGAGVSGSIDGVRVAIGTPDFVRAETGHALDIPAGCTAVAAGDERGWVRVTGRARPGIEDAARALAADYELHLLSGDHGADSRRWLGLFDSRVRFRQSPEDKLAYIQDARSRGRRVLMVGDGLNDAGALAAADVGMAVSDETACIAPACDAVISGARLPDLPAVLRYARRARQVVVLCFIVSVGYNAIGLGLALAGALTPLVTAILMPVSSLTVVGISSGAMRWFARRMLPV